MINRHVRLFLFPRLNKIVKGHYFATVEDLEQKLLSELKAIPQTAFQKCFEQKKNVGINVFSRMEDYFEANIIKRTL